MQNENLNKAVLEAFDFNPQVDKLHTTSDLQIFISKNDAINHARGLDDKTIQVFERDTDDDEDLDNDDVDLDPADKPLTAASVIALINEEFTSEGVLSLSAGDTRTTVIAAAKKRLALLAQQANEDQANNADEAFQQRQNENPGSLETSGEGAGDNIQSED